MSWSWSSSSSIVSFGTLYAFRIHIVSLLFCSIQHTSCPTIVLYRIRICPLLRFRLHIPLSYRILSAFCPYCPSHNRLLLLSLCPVQYPIHSTFQLQYLFSVYMVRPVDINCGNYLEGFWIYRVNVLISNEKERKSEMLIQVMYNNIQHFLNF